MALYETQLLQTPRTHSFTATRALDTAWVQLSELLTTVAGKAMCRFARDRVLGALNNISYGKLTIVISGESLTFGDTSTSGDAPQTTLYIKNEAFWPRVALFTDLGFAEGFMYGDVDCENMSCLFKILIANREVLRGLDNFTASLLAFGRRLTFLKYLGDLTTSPANISAHYDLGNVLFENFLSEDMNYSSGIFRNFNEDVALPGEPQESLKAAQIRKMQNIFRKADIKSGDRVLEIGTGWASLAILIAQTVDCTIDTVTLSSEQHALACKRIADQGLSDRITVHYMDFRECRKKPEWAGVFDKFISVEMIENVGKDFIREYWSVVDWALKPITARGVVQVITMPEARIPAYDSSGADFIQKWSTSLVFPGCYIPSLCFLVMTMNSGSDGRLTVDSVSNIGPHYARTLREWKRNLLRNWNSTIAKALQDRYGLNEDALEIFKRKWTYYFDYCEAGFATRSLGDHIIVFTREGNIGFGCDFNTTD